MRNLGIIITAILLSALFVTEAKADRDWFKLIRSYEEHIKISVENENWDEALGSAQLLNGDASRLKPVTLYYMGKTYAHHNKQAAAVGFLGDYLVKTTPSDKYHQSATMLFEQSKQQLPAYCQENSYICFRKAKASFYRNNEKGNLTTALLLHKSGCDGGSPEACSALAIMYKKGLGTEQNTTKALELFTFACDKKYARACELLGNIYRNGKIVAADLPMAVKYYRLDCHYKKGGECKQLKRLGVQYSSEARPISRFPPLYPIQAVMRGSEGSCKMTFDVSDKGKVQNVRTTCTNTIFSKAAKESIYQWKYEPKIVDGVAVASTDISTMLYFKLN